MRLTNALGPPMSFSRPNPTCARGAELARGGGDPVRGEAVAREEDFTEDDEGGLVRAEVLDEVRHAMQKNECLLGAVSLGGLVVAKAYG